MLFLLITLFGFGMAGSVECLCHSDEKEETWFLLSSVICFIGFAACVAWAVAAMP